ncbi:MAG: hypothetical protein M1814_003790 [Vezdaea aestivalis]|nr:MAG: hypothetical protein M1814_003790 [Vezdaea aestivalis]
MAEQTSIPSLGAGIHLPLTHTQQRIRRRNLGRECTFLAPALDSASQLKLTAIKEKVGSLERQLEQDLAAKAREAEDPGRAIPGQHEDAYNSHGPIPKDEHDLEPTPLAMIDAAYDDDADDEALDLGYMLGRMRLNDRLGGYFRPKIAEEIDATLKDSSHDHRPDEEKTMSLPRADFPPLHPPPTYIAPSSNFFFGSAPSQSSLIDFLPSKPAADRLLAHYYVACHPIIRIIHRPSFDLTYALFWENVAQNIEPAGSTQAVVFAILFMAVVSMDDADIVREFGTSKHGLVDNFRLGTETALARANFLRSTKVETLQAFVMYLIPLCRDAISRAHSALTGTAIRIAECMGLHRDGLTYGLSPVDTHVRRLVWFQLCFLDLRTVEAQGPRPQIRHDSFDTKFPLNVDDEDLMRPTTSKESRLFWTEMTLPLIRIECTEMKRTIWFDRPRIEKKQISLTTVLAKIESFHNAMLEKYSFLDLSIPIQQFCRHFIDMTYSGMHIGVLHRYHNSATTRIPDRLRQIVLTSGLKIMETFVKLETDPSYHAWAWYTGAWHQWHVALLLLIEIWMYPRRKEADRIWTCLDYAFNCPLHLSRDEKARQVLSELRDKSSALQAMRKMRIPAGLEQRLGAKPPIKKGEDGYGVHTQVAVSASVSVPNSELPIEVPGMEIRYSGVADGNLLINSAASPNPSTQSGSTRLSSPSIQTSSYDSAPITSSFNGVAASTAPSSNSQDMPIPMDDMMAEIDWNEWDKLFPPSINDGVLNLPDPPAPASPPSFSLPYQPTFHTDMSPTL